MPGQAGQEWEPVPHSNVAFVDKRSFDVVDDADVDLGQRRSQLDRRRIQQRRSAVAQRCKLILVKFGSQRVSLRH